ncbi:MAG TPA: hypothetical protein VGD65_00145 [Chryseosolibacter sp.]
MSFNKSLFLRKTHRYLGLFIGIQFLGWTITGLYFSWNNIDEVHGDHMRKSPRSIAVSTSLTSPDTVIAQLRNLKTIDSIHAVQLISVVGKPLYQVSYFSGHAGDIHPHVHYQLADATTGALRDHLTKDEAAAVAKDHVVSSATVQEVTFLEATDGHHEYRDRPLPAFAVSFSNPDCTVYISAERGTFQTIRHNQWRGFDFLWMLHTMDYESRDNINNWLLRIFSIFGFITVLSGFVLFLVSSRTLKQLTS